MVSSLFKLFYIFISLYSNVKLGFLQTDLTHLQFHFHSSKRSGTLYDMISSKKPLSDATLQLLVFE